MTSPTISVEAGAHRGQPVDVDSLGVHMKVALRHLMNAFTCSYTPYSDARAKENGGSHLERGEGALIISLDKQKKQSSHYGCIVENAAYGPTVTAVAAALGQMALCGGVVIDDVYFCTLDGRWPSGQCLQQIAEFNDQKDEVMIYAVKFDRNKPDCVGEMYVAPFSEVFPKSFGPANLAK